MANADWLVDVTAAVREVDNDLDLLVDVELIRRAATRSEVTGNREYEAPVTVSVRIEGYSRRVIDSERTLETAQHRVTLYEVPVSTGDRLRWDGENHTVLHVDGLFKDASGGRYLSRALVN